MDSYDGFFQTAHRSVFSIDTDLSYNSLRKTSFRESPSSSPPLQSHPRFSHLLTTTSNTPDNTILPMTSPTVSASSKDHLMTSLDGPQDDVFLTHTNNNATQQKPKDRFQAEQSSLYLDIDAEPLLFSATSHGKKRRRILVSCLDVLYSCVYFVLWRIKFLFSGRQTCTVERVIWLNGKTSPRFFSPNIIRNQRYNMFSLIPGVLLNQFSFFFNLFYLGVALSQLIPQLRIGPLFTHLVPLAIVLFLNILKEGYDDFQRYFRDQEINGALYEVLDAQSGSVHLTASQSLRVGDILRLHENQRVPCDVLLLRVHTVAQITFIRTDQLDGETDWKLRRPVSLTQQLSMEQELKHTEAWAVIEPPRFALVALYLTFLLNELCKVIAQDIYEFFGTFFLKKIHPVHTEIKATEHPTRTKEDQQGICDMTKTSVKVESTDNVSSDFGLKSSLVAESLSLENVLWASTVVTSGPVWVLVIYTGSDLRTVLNTCAKRSKIGIFDEEMNALSKALFCILVLVAGVLTIMKGISGVWFLNLCRFMLLLSSIIPISLRVNLDLAKAYYSKLISCDKKLEKTVVRNSSIPEELGRIEILLTDKTGTLTQNDMVFKKLHIGEAIFTNHSLPELRSLFEAAFVEHEKNINSRFDESPTVSLGQSHSIFDQRRYDLSHKLRKTLTALAVCHNVTPIREEMSGKISFQASSPDEMAMVSFAASVGLNLVERTDTSLTLLGPFSIPLHFELLFMFPFTSETKRMGCLVRRRRYGFGVNEAANNSTSEDNEPIYFFTKGAEIVMIPFLRSHDVDWLQEECDNFARAGLRTLVVAYRELSYQEYTVFSDSYLAAQLALRNRAELVQAAVATLERDLLLLALTGVEDKLQPGVPQTLEAFRHAGIRIWMLTGDKIETATCIAISAGLKSRHQSFMKFSSLDFHSVHEAQNALDAFASHASNCVLVTDSHFLNLALNYFPTQFITTACLCPAVICCRCSPTQKADITRLVQEITKKRTATIGDGGNDVSMILAAHYGIGIVGREGKQASLAADISVTQFQHIHRLLLWHGRNCYQRSAKLAQFVMHRGLVIATIQVIFSAVFFFIPMAIFQGWLTIGYTTYYTMLPVFSLVLDTELSESIVFMFPELYASLRTGRLMSHKTLLAWLWASVYQGAVIMLGAIVLFDKEFTEIISITFTSLIFAEMLNVASTVTSCHVLMIGAQILTLCIYFLSMVFLPNYFNLDFICSTTFSYKVAVITLASWLPLYCIKLLIRCLQPTRDSKLML